ncbi:uncharacterized protein LOC109947888 [Prunus persica]|uniref:uncharacterized protein LOC109947888 n=1 Tax=Prunus persica TaxID=3760 RepID=UPI0009AB797E|nr:uncharacterized protein LOC109947888 [Prunus persica]
MVYRARTRTPLSCLFIFLFSFFFSFHFSHLSLTIFCYFLFPSSSSSLLLSQSLSFFLLLPPPLPFLLFFFFSLSVTNPDRATSQVTKHHHDFSKIARIVNPKEKNKKQGGVIVWLCGSIHSKLLLEAKEEATSRSCIQMFVMHASMAIGMLMSISVSCQIARIVNPKEKSFRNKLQVRRKRLYTIPNGTKAKRSRYQLLARRQWTMHKAIEDLVPKGHN